MFRITEQQLALYKYQSNSRYYGYLMADILVQEYSSLGCQDIFKFVSTLYHRLIDVEKNIWEVILPDNSIILIKQNETGIYIKCLQGIDYRNADSYFP